ncbi:hypothetical protein [Nocardia sp. NPDC060249]|uniref:hypothetical protein n=1 Tax=Nocardia sp. NPDC060249 TaxID=3347082 RepID=UPI00364A6994
MSYFDTPELEAARAALDVESATFQLAEAQSRYADAMHALDAAQKAAEAEIDQLNKEFEEP